MKVAGDRSCNICGIVLADPRSGFEPDVSPLRIPCITASSDS